MKKHVLANDGINIQQYFTRVCMCVCVCLRACACIYYSECTRTQAQKSKKLDVGFAILCGKDNSS